jgi:hypothetical protein
MKRRAVALMVVAALLLAACSDGLWSNLQAGDCIEEDTIGGLVREQDLSEVSCDNLETDTHVYLVYWKGDLAELNQESEVAELAFCESDPTATFISNADEAICYVNRAPVSRS